MYILNEEEKVDTFNQETKRKVTMKMTLSYAR